MTEKLITIKDVHKEYKVENGDNVNALNGVTLDIDKNEFVCVVGPSGCGKTTLLNIIAGLETYDSGKVTMHGQPIVGPGPDRGVIFQQYALFPWMTVRKNIEYGLKFIRKPRNVESIDESGNKTVTTVLERYDTKEKHDLANRYIKMVNLTGFENSFPKALSGGMKQRVAIARGYALNSEVLLMDEPFGALDAQTRAQLQEDLLKTWETEKKTIFFITHDVDEAVLLATRVVIMSARPGQIKEIVDIDLPYPRTQATKLDPVFMKHKNYIWETVYKMYLEIPK
ncbi:MAG: ABC transporter ATP-binding protein [Sphaerochaetaceae bacterium]|nr:ABC transporter ATP-binding protein [Sphaerochaetaceae bacterium]NLO59871.1 ABC transporter ATP-binding protein [Spirochaetales bacterium]MDD2406876.1 ABC transporter ATP-binding protein [Sphaerochaetaceae bacterium]MDD3671020.1 ABC transporter ATP-binding protein [Sphaerochaetaceae bacterium]MDD4259961.1 ABC transporter ATP-binding protein [Sphaerochaetaceae bacterium]